MDSKVLSALLNPVRMKILQLFLQNETETVKRIAEELPSIPPASLYRHVNKLVEGEIIEVCAEYKIRGTVEKVYRLKNNSLLYNDEQILEAGQEEVFSYFYSFATALLSDFDNYLSGKDYDLGQDRVSFQSYPLYLTDQECDELFQTIQETLNKVASNKEEGERRLRKFSFVLIPGDENKKVKK
ncbi:helix-turn-helix domain-containing protein [Desulfitobacterium sp. PCE1]|uniref:helix-turn-helix domain-containing protein n=1 Tax=Desulfitobacterium sp. PCE1 TaxID=146907 RepID=UPI000375F83D|nr:helix-turn-helix domain-containing protein [Desulfitobacterium sp. PCE1]